MWKSLINIFILALIFGCSSAPKRVYKVDSLEKRGDEYFNMGDRLRLEKQYKDSLQYYNQASDIYFLKGNKQKYVISELKKCLILLKKDKVKETKVTLENAMKVNKMELLALENDIAGIQVRLYEKTGDKDKAVEILNQLITNYANNIEKRLYYIALLAEKFEALTLPGPLQNELVGEIEELNEMYEDGKLENPEGLIYISFVASLIFLNQQKYNEAYTYLKRAEFYVHELELVGQYQKIYETFVILFQQSDQKERATYYSKVLAKYLNTSKGI